MRAFRLRRGAEARSAGGRRGEFRYERGAIGAFWFGEPIQERLVVEALDYVLVVARPHGEHSVSAVGPFRRLAHHGSALTGFPDAGDVVAAALSVHAGVYVAAQGS